MPKEYSKFAGKRVAEKQPAGSKRYHELDVLRGLAAIAVIVCHYTSECNFHGRLDPEFVFQLGGYGAHLFFVVSGFVIFMSLQRCERPIDFAFGRFARLYPIYWFGVILSTVILLTAPQATSTVPTLKQFFANLTMLQTWLRIPDIEDVYWTLGVELKFYFLTFMILVMGWQKRAEFLVCAWLGAVVAFRFVDAMVGLPHVMATPLVLDYAHLFAAGIMFYRIQSAGESRLRHAIIFLAVPLQFWAAGFESSVVVALFVAGFYLFVYGKLKWIVTRPLIFLGKISYAIYLVHGVIGIASIHFLAGKNAPLWLMFAVPSVISLAVATLLHFHLEKPSGIWLKNWWKQRSGYAGLESQSASS